MEWIFAISLCTIIVRLFIQNDRIEQLSEKIRNTTLKEYYSELELIKDYYRKMKEKRGQLFLATIIFLIGIQPKIWSFLPKGYLAFIIGIPVIIILLVIFFGVLFSTISNEILPIIKHLIISTILYPFTHTENFVVTIALYILMITTVFNLKNFI